MNEFIDGIVVKSHTDLTDLNPADEHAVLRKLFDIPEYQNWMKNRFGHFADVTFAAGGAGEDYCEALTFDGTYIWAGLWTEPAKILKINPFDNSYTVITCAAGENKCTSLTFDGTHVWAGLSPDAPAKILKINPVNNSYTVITAGVGQWYCRSLTFDGTYVWAGITNDPATVLKINPADNSFVSVTEDVGESVAIYAMTFDGTYVYAGLNLSPFKILKIDPSDNSIVVITGAAGENKCDALTFDGTYVWAGLCTDPAKILKINPTDNSYIVIEGTASADCGSSMIYDGTYVWCGCYTYPAKIMKINPIDNNIVTITAAATEDACLALLFDGTYVWCGLETSPAKLLRKFAHKRSLDYVNRRPPEMFMDLLVKSTTGVHAAIAGTGALQTITAAITHPDIPRNISVTTTNNAAPSGTVTITGNLANGQTDTEDITIVAGATAFGNKAFATVYSFTVPAGVGAGDTVSIGFSDKVGLSSLSASSLIKVKENNADATGTYSLNTTYATVDLADIGGGDDFTIWYHADK